MKNHKIFGDLEKAKSRNLWGLLILILIDGFGGGMNITVFQPFILAFTGSMFLTGVLTTLGVIAFILPRPFIGRLSDRYGRKKIFLLGTPSLILGFLLIILANNLFILIIGIIILNLGGSFGGLSFQMFVSESSKEKRRGFNFGLTAFAAFTGGILGKFFVTFGLFADIRFYFLIYIILLYAELSNSVSINGFVKLLSIEI